ncbi:uncharacterized protein LOC144452142 [Glandiceps talaboti]
MLVTPIDARERSIQELTGHKPGKGTRMYVGQRRSDPDFREDISVGRMRNPNVRTPHGARQRRGPPSVPKTAAPPAPVFAPIQASPGKTLLHQYVDTGMVEGPSLKPWKSPWEEAMDHPSGWIDTSYTQIMRQYRPGATETTSFQRTGTSLGPHRRSHTAPAGEAGKPLVKSRELVAQSTGRKARGAVMFDRMKKRSEQFVVDESNVVNPSDYYARRRIEMLQRARPRVPSPPPHVGTGYHPKSPTTPPSAPRPQRQQKMSLMGNMTPWEAAEINPVGSIEEAFAHTRSRPGNRSLVNNVQEAARTKKERAAYEISPWTQCDDQLSYRLPPKITPIPRVRLGAQPYINDFNRKAEGWESLPAEQGGGGSDQTQYHTFPRRRETQGRDYNPRPKSWAREQIQQEFHDQPAEDEADVVEHLRPVRQTAKKFDRPSYANRRRARPSNVKPVAGPKIWNPSMLEETEDL